MCVCVQRRPLCARRLDSVHLQRQRGQKRHPFLLLGRGAVDTNKPPPHHPHPLLLPPRCVGVMSGMSRVLLSPGALFLGTHHQAFSAAHSASSLPLTPKHTYMGAHIDTHNTPPGQCVPWSLTLNRPPQLNTTDRQASGHQVQQPKSCNDCPVGKIQPVIFTCLVPSRFLSYGRKKIKQWLECFRPYS